MNEQMNRDEGWSVERSKRSTGKQAIVVERKHVIAPYEQMLCRAISLNLIWDCKIYGEPSGIAQFSD
jgi:hypothetical protein